MHCTWSIVDALHMVYSECKGKISDMRGGEHKSARTLQCPCYYCLTSQTQPTPGGHFQYQSVGVHTNIWSGDDLITSIMSIWRESLGYLRPAKVDSLFLISHFLNFHVGGRSLWIHYYVFPGVTNGPRNHQRFTDSQTETNESHLNFAARTACTRLGCSHHV